jgi:hypothetical protein
VSDSSTAALAVLFVPLDAFGGIVLVVLARLVWCPRDRSRAWLASCAR